jgi:hypothetical protein
MKNQLVFGLQTSFDIANFTLRRHRAYALNQEWADDKALMMYLANCLMKSIIKFLFDL